MPARARLARSIARVEAAALPSRLSLPQVHPRAWLARFAPTRRSLAVGFGLLAVALGGYLLARETALFAIDRIEVRGGSPQVARQVRSALASLVGRPLVGLDGSAVLARVDALPTVVSASYDRSFPHTLRITVVPERPAAVLRRGPDSWLVSRHGRVMERLPADGCPAAAANLDLDAHAGADRCRAHGGRRRRGRARRRPGGRVCGPRRLGVGDERHARLPPPLGSRAPARGRRRHQAEGRGGRTRARRSCPRAPPSST